MNFYISTNYVKMIVIGNSKTYFTFSFRVINSEILFLFII